MATYSGILSRSISLIQLRKLARKFRFKAQSPKIITQCHISDYDFDNDDGDGDQESSEFSLDPDKDCVEETPESDLAGLDYPNSR
jgi:hypothetical protein